MLEPRRPPKSLRAGSGASSECHFPWKLFHSSYIAIYICRHIRTYHLCLRFRLYISQLPFQGELRASLSPHPQLKSDGSAFTLYLRPAPNTSTDSRSKSQPKPNLPSLPPTYLPPMTAHPKPASIAITAFHPHCFSVACLSDNVREARYGFCFAELLCVEVFADCCGEGCGGLFADSLWRYECGCRGVMGGLGGIGGAV